MQNRKYFFVCFALQEDKTQNGFFMGRRFDQVPYFISECAGVGVPCGHRCEVRQRRRNVVPRGRMVRQKGAEFEKCAPS